MKLKLLGFALAFLSIGTIGVAQLHAASNIDNSPDCDKYAIVRCGTFTESKIRSTYYTGDHNNVFAAFGISKSEISGMKTGVVYRNGNVKVGGKVVATGGVMAARHLGGSSISGSSSAKRLSVSHMGSAQTALVKFDSNGRFMFAIMKPCGNPVVGTPTKPKPKPAAVCKALTVNQLDRTRFRFDGSASASNGAKVSQYVFQVYKSGQLIDTVTTDSTSTSASANYTQDEAGTYAVKLTVKTSVGDKTSTNCTKSFTVTPSKTPGVDITKLVNGEKYLATEVDTLFDYQLKVTNTGETDLNDVVVTDTPDKGVTLVSAEKGSISDNTWTYTIPELKIGESMEFTLKAKVPSYKAGKIDNTACVNAPEVPGSPDKCDNAKVSVPKNVKVCNPETGEIITVKKAEADQYAPVDSDKCKEAPPELPTTGPSDVMMQLAGVFALSSAITYYVASRRAVS